MTIAILTKSMISFDDYVREHRCDGNMYVWVRRPQDTSGYTFDRFTELYPHLGAMDYIDVTNELRTSIRRS